MSTPRPIKESLLGLTLLALGFFLLPALVFFVGVQVLGDYEAGLPAFYESIGNAVLVGNPFAWLLVLSPLLSVQLARFFFWLRRQRRTVT